MPSLNSEILVILINLDRAKNRLAKMESRLSSIGADYTRLPAVDGKAYNFTGSEFNEKLYRRYVGKKKNTGEIGCYLSHYNAINLFLENQKKYAIILEDDAVFNPDFANILNKLAIMPDDWDFVKFNTARDGGFGNVAVKNLFGNYKLYASFFPKTYSAAYMINRKAGLALKSKLLPMTVPFDHEMIKFWKYDIKQYSVFPSPVSVEYLDTNIGGYDTNVFKFPPYKRISVLLYRIYTQIKRALNFYKLLKKH
ncbi:MAG: glycosyltransferase family 25 protein [Opitutales bacterium]|nr:glycosyltransferase family 25 protein [Opitutales bacterium]